MFGNGHGRDRILSGLLVPPTTPVKRNTKPKPTSKKPSLQNQPSQSISLPPSKSSLPKKYIGSTESTAESSISLRSCVSSGTHPHEGSNVDSTLTFPPVTEVIFADSTPYKLSETEGSVELRRNELKQKLMDRRRDLINYRQKAKEEIRSIEIALRNLTVATDNSVQTAGGVGVAVDSTENTDSTAPSTPDGSPVSTSNRSGLVKPVHLTNDRKATSEDILQEVKGLEWTVVAQERRTGMYSGTALNGKIPHGSGSLVFTANEMYHGPFVYGVMQGAKGVLMESGSTYEGEFRLNMKYGTGEEMFPCGSLYRGKYKNGVPHGLGARYNPDGTLLYLGQWVHGEPCDKVKESLQNSYDLAFSPLNQHLMHPFVSDKFEDFVLDADSSTRSIDHREVSMYRA